MQDLEVVRRHPVKQAVTESIPVQDAVAVHRELLQSEQQKIQLGALKLYYETQDALAPGGAGKHLHFHVPDLEKAREMMDAVREARTVAHG